VNNENVKIEVQTGTQKKDASKTWKGLRISIGDWSTLIFPKSNFEMEYIEKTLAEGEQ